MGGRRIRAIGQFAWSDADIGVECLTCGHVQVYCDFEAIVRFRERRWSPDLDEAAKRFRCRCGSRDIRLRPVSITKRPKPIPSRPAALRPIYAEPARSLFGRGPSRAADPAALDTAVAEIRAAAAGRWPVDAGGEKLGAAMEAVRPHLYDQDVLTAYAAAIGEEPGSPWRGTAVDGALTAILRQLGLPR